MSMSTHIVGFRPADDEWNMNKNVWETCETAGVTIPQEVMDFFDDEAPSDKPGMEVELSDDACKEYQGDMVSGYEVDISKLPQGVQFIRFYNSY